MPVEPFRVVHVGKFYPPHMGGMETNLQLLAEELGRSLDVRVLVANDGRRSVDELVGGVRVSRLATAFELGAAPVCPGLVRRLRAVGADIVHLHWPNPMAVLAYLASGHRGPLVITYHSDVVKQRAWSRAFQPLLDRALGRAAVILVTSPRYLETSPVLGPHRDRCRVLPYGIRTDAFGREDGALAAALRKRYGRRLVLSVGRLTYYKGFEYLIAAMRDVDGRLLIAGDGPLRPSLEGQARDLGIEDRVVFLGEIPNDDLAPYYHASDVFALASVARSEAFAIVQLEAMAAGRPVVNTRLPSGVPWVSPDGETGITVPPRDSRALAQALTRLLDDPFLRAKYGEAGRRRVREHFTVDVMTRKTLQCYADVMRGDRPADTSGVRPAASQQRGGSPVGDGHVTAVVPVEDRSRPAKRTFDVVLAGLGLVLSGPLWVLLALAIKLDDRGPIFFRQARVGRGGRLFMSWKFRSMVSDAETRFGLRQAGEHDARVTRVGRLLRATALDELPQLWNIFVGDMSFVGPRPLVPEEAEVRGNGEVVTLDKIPGYEARHRVRPGLTGVAQIYAPRDIPRRLKFRYDQLYIAKQGLWLDLRLIVLSFWITARGRWEDRGAKF